MTSRDQRRAKVRNTIKGTVKRPRLVVFRSNRYIYAQLIDDSKGTTLLSVDKMTDSAKAGNIMAQKAINLKIKTVVFDRAGYKYHGKIKNFAQAVREGGLII